MNKSSDADDVVDRDLSRIYRDTQRDEPSAHLDAAVLAEARRALNSGPRSSRWQHWPAVASVAAVVMVSLLLVPTMMHEEQLAKRAAPEKTAPANAPAREADSVAAPAAKSAMPANQFADEAPAALPETRRQETAERRRSEAPALLELQTDSEAPAPVVPTVDEWLAKIRELAEAGDEAEAREQLQALRRVYPNASVETELLERLDIAPR